MDRILIEKSNLFESLFNDVDGSEIFTEGRVSHGLEATQYFLYGEVPFDIFFHILTSNTIKDYVKDAKVFYDFGSGLGRLVLATNIILPHLEKYKGIELLENLHDKALEIKKKYLEINPEEDKKIEFINDDILYTDIDDADIVFVSYPSLDFKFQDNLEEKMIRELKSGTIVFTIIKPLKSIEFKLLNTESFIFPWGKANVFFYVKK